MPSEQRVPLRVKVSLGGFDEDKGEENGSFRELAGSLLCLYQHRCVQTVQMQCKLLRGTVQHRKMSTGRQPLTSWSI